MSAISSINNENSERRLFGWLQYHRSAGGPSAGASFHVAIRIGKFQGMIWPTTPKFWLVVVIATKVS